MIKSFDEFKKVSDECAKALACKFNGETGKRAVVLCGGTGCLSSNSAEIKEKIEKLIVEKGLEDKVTVGSYLARVHAEVKQMAYYIVGEGIEKKQEDFAAEVMSQIK